MGLDPRFIRLAKTILPNWLLAKLDPVEYRIEHAVRQMAEGTQPGQWVLDAGCGENRFKQHFNHCHFVGCDSGVGDPDWDYRRLDVVADLHRLPFGDEVFDAGLLIVTLEHMRRPWVMMAEAGRVTKPGGQWLMVVPLLWEVHQAPNDFFRFTRYGLASLLAEAGFTVTDLRPLGGFFTVAARWSVNCLSFFQRSWRWPLFVLLLPWLGLVFPLLLRLLDWLDPWQDFTLGYELLAVKKQPV